MFTVAQAAKKLGQVPLSVYKMVYSGRLPATKNAFGIWEIDERDLIRYQLRRRPSAKETPEIRMAEALERINERLQRIEALLVGVRLEEPRPEWKAPARPGVNPLVEEKDV